MNKLHVVLAPGPAGRRLEEAWRQTPKYNLVHGQVLSELWPE